MKRYLALLLVVALAVCLVACASTATTAPTTAAPATATADAPTTATAAPATPPATAASGDGIAITDIVGNQVVLPAAATKLVGTHNPTLNQAIVLGGGAKYLVGFGSKGMADDLYAIVCPEIESMTQIGKGKEINYETVLETGADLAILPERFKDQAAEFEKIGVPALVITASEESFDSVRNALTILGQAVGEEQRAADLIAMFDAKIENATTIAATATETPNVLMLGTDKNSVVNGVMLQSTLIEAGGGVNVAADLEAESAGFVDVNTEQIVAWNPDVIYIPQYADYTLDDILNSAELSSVSAVKNKKVYVFPSLLEPWDYPTISSALGLCWVTQNLHPDLYSKDQLVQDADDLYNLVYGQSFTAEQLGIE